MRSSRRRLTSATPSPAPTPPQASAQSSAPVSRDLWRDAPGTFATRSLQIIIVAVLLIGVVVALRAVSVVVIPITIALILACAFAPVITWLRAHGFSATWAAFISLGSILAVGGAVVWLIVVQVRDQWNDLVARASEGLTIALDWLDAELGLVIDQAELDEFFAAVSEFLMTSSFANSAWAGVSAVTGFVTAFILLSFVLYYFVRDGQAIWAFVLRPFHGKAEERARRIGTKTVDILGTYVRGTAVIAAFDAIAIGIFLFIFQVPLALPLAVLVFVLAFIPIVGATIAGVLATLIALVANGLINALIILAIVIAVNQIESNFLQASVLSRSLKMHSLVIMVALAIGGLLGGIVGAALAVPMAAVAWGIVQVWDGPDLPARWARRPQRAS